MFWGAWAACLPAIQRATGASDAQLGLALLCVALAALPAMLVAGRLSDAFGGARLVPIFLVFFGLVATLPGLARSVGMLVVFLALIGIATGLLDISINSHASRLEALHGIRIMDGLHASFSAGVVVGSVGAGLLRHAGAQPSWILAGVAVVGASAAFVNRGPYPSRRHVSAVGGSSARWSSSASSSRSRSSSRTGWRHGARSSSSGRWTRARRSAGSVPGLFAGAMVTGRVLAQRVDWPSVPGRMLFAGLASATGLAIAATSQHAAVALAGFVIAGGGLALSAPTLFGLAGRLGGEGGRGAALSTVAILGYLGFVAGPALIGAVSGASSLRGGFLFLCAVAVVLAACAPILRRVVGETGG